MRLEVVLGGAGVFGFLIGWVAARWFYRPRPTGRAKGREPRIVCLGGGHGMSALLRGLKAHTSLLTAIVSVADDGGSSGRLRRDYRVLPPGDIRMCLAALASRDDLIGRMFQFRFEGAGELSGHSLGNLLLTGLGAVTGNFLEAIRVSGEVLAITGEVLPSTLEPLRLWAVRGDGTVVEGESAIPKPGASIRELKLSLEDPEPAPGVVERIAAAELIVIAPGSLFTSILPNLLVPRIRAAIARSRAPVVVVMNAMTQPGETDGFTTGDHLRVLRELGGLPRVSCVVVPDRPPPPEVAQRYAATGAHPVELDRATIEELGEGVVRADLVAEGDFVHHDPAKLARAILARLDP